jgi:integrase
MVLRDAMDNGRVVRDVTRTVKRVEADPDAGADRGEWQADDAVRFLRSVVDDRLYTAFVLSMFGLRRGEVLGLRWDHIDLTGAQAKQRKLPDGTPSVAVVNNRVITLDADDNELFIEGTPKGKGRRRAPYLPIPRLLVDALTTLQLRQMEEADRAGDAYGSCPQCTGAHLVLNELGQPYRPQWYSDRFVSLGKALGLTRVPLHGSRPCAASLLADLGVADVAIAAWLGHTKVEVTQGYTHVFADEIAAAYRAARG